MRRCRPHDLGLRQVIPNPPLTSLNDIVNARQDNSLEQQIEQAKGYRQPNQLRREGIRIERRELGMSTSLRKGAVLSHATGSLISRDQLGPSGPIARSKSTPR